MKASATLTFLLSVLGSFSAIHSSQSLQWAEVTNGNIPDNAVKVSGRNKSPHYPCRVSGSSQTPSYGILSGAGDGRCEYADNNQQQILSSASFDILVGDQSRVGLKWLGASGRPSEAEIRRGRAIPCHLNIGTHSDCYLGQGVYSDGICREEFGVVLPSKGFVFMKDPYTYDKVSLCGAYRFIVYN